MKRLLIVVALQLFILVPFIGEAQKVEITPTIGYQFGGKINFYEGTFKIENAMNYGVTLGVDARQAMIEVYWTRMDTRARWDPYNPASERRDLDMNVQYFQIGGIREQKIADSPLIGFGGLTIGAVYFNMIDESVEDVWRFAATLGGGIKVIVTEKIGLRFQGRLLMPIYGGGGGLYCGIGSGGSGCGVSLGATSWLLQGDFTGGLIFRLGN